MACRSWSFPALYPDDAIGADLDLAGGQGLGVSLEVGWIKGRRLEAVLIEARMARITRQRRQRHLVRAIAQIGEPEARATARQAMGKAGDPAWIRRSRFDQLPAGGPRHAGNDMVDRVD